MRYRSRLILPLKRHIHERANVHEPVHFHERANLFRRDARCSSSAADRRVWVSRSNWASAASAASSRRTHPEPQPIPKGQNLTQRTMEHFHFWQAEDRLRAAKTIPKGYGIGGLVAYGTLLGPYHYDWMQRELRPPLLFHRQRTLAPILRPKRCCARAPRNSIRSRRSMAGARSRSVRPLRGSRRCWPSARELAENP